jgi:signal transduction histidine kinase
VPQEPAEREGAQPPSEFRKLPGEVATLLRAIDWSKTSLGPMSTWPRSLKTTVGVMVGSRFPMMLGWGSPMIQFYNDAYIPVLGVKHPGSMGAPVSQVWSEIWDVVGPLMHSVLSGGPALWREHQLLFINSRGFAQETFHTFSQSPVPDDDGGVGGVLLTVQETTEQVQGERQLQVLHALADRSSYATSLEEASEFAASILRTADADVPFALIYLLGVDGTEARLTASSPAVVPSDVPSLVPLSANSPTDGRWPFREVLSSGQAVRIDDLKNRFAPMPGGRYAVPPERALVLPLSRDATDHYGFLVLGLSPWRTVSERYLSFLTLLAAQLTSALSKARSAEEERERREAMAELDRAKTLFFSNVSHELRTPLTLMLGPTTDALLAPERRLEGPSLEAVHRNALRLQRLVGTLLDFARIESGRAKAAFELVELSTLTADLASAFESAMEGAGLVYEVRCERLPRPVYVDPDMWEKILLNLISNALKFTFEGRIRVSLASRDDQVVLTVEDTGTGIPADQLPHVFDRFHRVQGARARTVEGSGIGLALVHELVRIHGGSVAVKSTLEVGTTFTVTMPMRETPEVPEARFAQTTVPRIKEVAAPFVEEALRWLPNAIPWSSSASITPAPAATGPNETRSVGRVLVVDDNADMRDYLVRVIAPHWEVETAADGEIALAAARSRRPDVILTDAMMPNLDGFGLVARLRQIEDTADIPVIMLSARAGEESRIEGLQAGADDYLIKPFSARELLARVRVHLTLAQLRRGLLERAVEARRAAEDTTRAKDEFLAMLGHELRNPLSPIVTATRLLKLRGVDGKEIQIIDRQLRQLVRLVNDLLDVSRITRGKIDLREERVTLADVVTRAIETTSPLLEQRRHPLAVSVPDTLVVSADPGRLAQVFGNLLTNAAKYSDPGTEIRVRAQALGNRVEIRIQDRGIGIRPDLLDRVFDLFVQQPQSLDRAAGGLGLGLAIVQNLVKAHGGSVRAESAGVGTGSEFIVDLPLAISTTERLQPTDPAGSNDAQPAATHRVLVVDDNEDAAETLAQTLAAIGHRVRVAFDGKTALDVAANFHPEVVLLDIGLPLMDGYELASRLKKLPGGAGVCLIAVTGYGQARDRAAAKQAGFAEHLVKPVDLVQLENLIANAPSVSSAWS